MNGIGGNTIDEAQHNISYPEFLQWAAYRQKRGSLNIGMRVERGAVLIAALYSNSKRGRDAETLHIHDFSPYSDQPEITLDDLKSWSD